MHGNTIIVEVKGQIAHEGCIKDFETISLFIRKYEYKLGVFVLYNRTIQEFSEELLNDIRKLFHQAAGGIANKIYILCKKSPLDETECMKLLDLLA